MRFDPLLATLPHRSCAGPYSDGRRPDSVTFGDSLLEDLARRDFTINAMALDPHQRLLYDPFGGQQDLLDGGGPAGNASRLA